MTFLPGADCGGEITSQYRRGKQRKRGEIALRQKSQVGKANHAEQIDRIHLPRGQADSRQYSEQQPQERLLGKLVKIR